MTALYVLKECSHANVNIAMKTCINEISVLFLNYSTCYY